MRFTSLGSGSSGNGLVVESGRTRVMMDCGFSIAETKARLERAGLGPSQLTAIVVTHEHDDHMGGVARFAMKYAIPVYLTRGTGQWLPVDLIAYGQEAFPGLLAGGRPQLPDRRLGSVGYGGHSGQYSDPRRCG